MDTLQDHNRKARGNYHRAGQANTVPAGVACNKCGAEMVYDNFDMTLASDPPMKTVVCPSCGETGTKVY